MTTSSDPRDGRDEGMAIRPFDLPHAQCPTQEQLDSLVRDLARATGQSEAVVRLSHPHRPAVGARAPSGAGSPLPNGDTP